jgi:hypothetical protein
MRNHWAAPTQRNQEIFLRKQANFQALVEFSRMTSQQALICNYDRCSVIITSRSERALPGSADLISVIKCGRKAGELVKNACSYPRAIRANHVVSCISGVYTLCACTFIADYRMLGRAPPIKCISKRSWVVLKTLQLSSSAL